MVSRGWVETPHGFVNLDLLSHISFDKSGETYKVLGWTGTHRLILSEGVNLLDVQADYDSLRGMLGLIPEIPDSRMESVRALIDS